MSGTPTNPKALESKLAALRARVAELERAAAEHDRTAEMLHSHEERYRLLYERAPLGYQSLDERGYFLEVNQAWLDLMGYSREEVIGRWFGDFLTPECVEHFRRRFPCFQSEGEIHRVQFDLLRKDGARLSVEYDGKIGFDTHGEFQQTHCILHDISDRKRAEEELARYRDQLEELVARRTRELEESQEKLRRSERLASVGTLAAGIAHEINNPVGGILLTSEFALAAKDDRDGLVKALDNVVRLSGRAKSIVENVQRFARAEASEKTPGDLNTVVRHAVVLTGKYARERCCTVDLTLGEELPELAMDPVGIEQVAVNLIKNAIEAGANHVTIRTELTVDSMRLVCEDNGSGILEDKQKHLFDPFYTTRQSQGGMGLGLSIVHGIVQDHGGAIDVVSEPGGGAKFTISLPLAMTHQDGRVEDDQDPHRR